jgi:hypothetical protein
MNPTPVHPCFVEVRVVNPGTRTTLFSYAAKTLFVSDGDDFVCRSRLDPALDVSEHLRWLHMVLQHERKRLRQLLADGVDVFCRIRVRGRTLTIKPDALLLMHQCQLRVEIAFNP